MGGGWQNRNCWRSETATESKQEKSRPIAVTGHHRKHGIRLLRQSRDNGEQQPAVKGRRISRSSDPGLADRICGKRLNAALAEVHSVGHLDQCANGCWRSAGGPTTPAHQDQGNPPVQTPEESVAGQQYSCTDLRRLECAATHLEIDLVVRLPA